MNIKRTLYLTHRWFGIGMCLMFLLWFASGIVMMYVEYPELTEQERITGLPPLNLNAIDVDIQSLKGIISSDQEITDLTILTVLDRPAYQLQFADGGSSIIYADTAEFVAATTVASAQKVANIYAKNANIGVSSDYIESTEMDQWTVYGGFNQHRPLHKVALNNQQGTILYISNNTAQVLRDTHRWERAWNWVGSTIHWIYPMQLRKHSSAWVNVVIIISSLGIVAVVTGTVVGILRLRVKRRYKNGSVTPYSGMQKWHHLLGLTFTLFVAMFVVSGLFSMNPFGMFNNKTSASAQISRYQGAHYSLVELQAALDTQRMVPQQEPAIKELSWHQVNGNGVLVGRTNTGQTVLNYKPQNLDSIIKDTIPLLLPEHTVTELTKLESFDNYYYSTHNRYRPLPAYRVKFNDQEKTWYYIDANTGELLNRSTKVDRVQRWLYNGLHSLDFQVLLSQRPLWDIIVLTLSIIGIVFSYSSLSIAWRRLKKTKPFKIITTTSN